MELDKKVLTMASRPTLDSVGHSAKPCGGAAHAQRYSYA